jgi:hypothetical protein
VMACGHQFHVSLNIVEAVDEKRAPAPRDQNSNIFHAGTFMQ